MDTPDYEKAILELVRRTGYRPLKPRQIATRLQVSKDEVAEVKRAVKRLMKQGQLVYGASHLVSPADPAAPKGNRIVGVFRRTESGYGFVRPSGQTTGDARVSDIFIPARYASDAANGDQVVVRLRKAGHRRPDSHGPERRGPRGEIVEIIQRQTYQFVGTILEVSGTALVRVDGNLFERPISLGDPGSKNVQPNDKVVFEMVRFPTNLNDGEGVITEVLGPRGKPGVDTLSILREFALPEQFAEDALDEARRQAEEFEKTGDEIPADRSDLTNLTIITIDPIDARDFDDAISLERSEDGQWRLGVHIADVTHFVSRKSALDREARDRATSVYLPDRVVPMLPELISNGLASLQPDKVRYTKTAFLDFTADGLRVASQLHSAAIRSRRRFTYEEVDEYLKNPEEWRSKLTPEVHALLGRMHQLAMILRRRRLERGALELTMPEVKIDLDKQGRVSGAHVVENTISHQIIEEFMLAANEAVAETLRDHDLPFLRRVHESPALEKLKALGEFVTELGIKNDGLESRFELQKLLDRVVGRPEQHAVNYAVLRSMQRAVYDPREEGHYALASDCYCHFTSPIRRYPDLTIHRLVHSILTGEKAHGDLGKLAVLGEHCSERERRAETAERELTKVKLLTYLSTRLGEEMEAVITGVETFGLFAQGLELPAEGLIRVETLADDVYRFDRTAHTLAGYHSGNSFRLGDVVRVAVARVDIERRELDFRLVGHRARPESGEKLSVRRGKRKDASAPARPRKPSRPKGGHKKGRNAKRSR